MGYRDPFKRKRMKNFIRQEGIILVTVLLFFLLLSLLGVHALHAGLLEIKIADNFHQEAELFSSAEQALVQAEERLVHDKEALCLFYPGTLPPYFWQTPG